MEVKELALRYFKDVLSNGLTLVTVEMPHIHTMEVSMFVRAGLRFETEKNNGVSHFLEHMMFRGNQKYPNSISLNMEFENIGRDLRASTLGEYTQYGFSPHVSQLDKGMELFAEFFSSPTFPEIELERGIILEEYFEELNEDGINVDINNHACKLLYPGTPISWPTIGTEETIKSINVEMLRNYFKAHYIPGNMVLAVSGPVEHETSLSLVEKYFSKFSNTVVPIIKNHFIGSIPEAQSQPQFLFQYDSDSQIELQLCFRSCSYNHEDFLTMGLISRIFDDGFTSRLQRVLREERGLVYSVECRATSMSDIGTMDFDVTVRPEKLIEVTQALLQEIKTFVTDGPTDYEVAHVKKRYMFDLDSELDDPYKQVVRYGFPHLYSEELSVEDEQDQIQMISKEKIIEVSKKTFVANMLNLTLVGPYTSQLQVELEKLIHNY
ncbi:MAG: zinc-dependent peptidase, M16 family protein [Nitrospina sp.]|jgi:predicted Zn-dependent peptidase|nr:zinc-dependent peptidase, M16 family protein [Nitrospina sp.]|tara:strand:+ start:1476 stop:2786 length:1311 start_codon:yes stop_codon:yes gene_type:complete